MMPYGNALETKNSKNWLKNAKGFYERTKFPNCVRAIDGKHIQNKKGCSHWF